jgi:gas vesicle protein
MKEETVMNKDYAIGFGIGLLAGAVIGGVIALLYAPQSGKETRQQIKEKATEVVDAVKEKTTGAVHAIKS